MQKQPIAIGGTWPPFIDLPVLERADADSQLVLAGQRVLVTASARRGVHSLLVHPDRVLFDLQTGIGSELIRTPAALARRIRVEDTEASEHVCVAGTEPIVVWCWRAEEAVDVRFSWKIALRQRSDIADAGAPRWHVHGPVLRVALTDNDTSAAFAFSEAVNWTLTREGSDVLSVSARLRLPHHRDVWLAMAAVNGGEEIDRVFDRFRDAARIPIARAAAFRKRAREHLRVTSSDETLASTVVALIDRVETSLIEMPRGAAPISETPGESDRRARVIAIDACTIASAAAAVGDATLPRATLRFLHASRTADGLVPVCCSSDDTCGDPSEAATAAWLSLAASYYAWSGDDGLLRELWPDLASSARRLSPDRFGQLLRALAITAESVGDAASAGDFRRATPNSEPLPPWHTGSHARSNVRAAHHLLKLVHQRFGLDPDAPRGRLRARLDTPRRWRNFHIDNIRLGDARVSIGVNQDARHTRITASPTAGAIPIRLILEPVLSRVPSHITIDGTPAQLDLKPHRHRVIAPVQIELDHTRTVDFYFDA